MGGAKGDKVSQALARGLLRLVVREDRSLAQSAFKTGCGKVAVGAFHDRLAEAVDEGWIERRKAGRGFRVRLPEAQLERTLAWIYDQLSDAAKIQGKDVRALLAMLMSARRGGEARLGQPGGAGTERAAAPGQPVTATEAASATMAPASAAPTPPKLTTPTRTAAGEPRAPGSTTTAESPTVSFAATPAAPAPAASPGEPGGRRRAEGEADPASQRILDAIARLAPHAGFGGLVKIPDLVRALGETPSALAEPLRRLARAGHVQLDPLADPLGVADSERALGIPDPVRGLLFYVSPVRAEWKAGRR